MEDPSVKLSSQQVVSGSDRVDVPGQVQVKLFHGDALRVTATSSTTFDTEGWALRRLTNTCQHSLLQVSPQSLRKADQCGRLAFTQGSRGNTTHNNIVTLVITKSLTDTDVDLSLSEKKGRSRRSKGKI